MQNKALCFNYKMGFERVLTDPCEESYDQITKGPNFDDLKTRQNYFRFLQLGFPVLFGFEI